MMGTIAIFLFDGERMGMRFGTLWESSCIVSMNFKSSVCSEVLNDAIHTDSTSIHVKDRPDDVDSQQERLKSWDRVGYFFLKKWKQGFTGGLKQEAIPQKITINSF